MRGILFFDVKILGDDFLFFDDDLVVFDDQEEIVSFVYTEAVSDVFGYGDDASFSDFGGS